MKYDIYYHNDFDGRASAAVMLNFLRSRGDSAIRYVPVAFDIKSQWPTLRFPRPTVIVDFIYHPRATFWFDHHLTSFIISAWEKKFRKSKFHVWDNRAPSCCGLVVKMLKKNFGFNAPPHLRELAQWLDVIDSAGYRSPKEALSLAQPAFQIGEFIDAHSSRGQTLSWLIELMSRKSLTAVVRDRRIRKVLPRLKVRRASAFKIYRKCFRVDGSVGIVDLGTKKIADLRFFPYYAQPDLLYNMVVKEGKSHYRLSVGKNPWRAHGGKVNIGALLARYGGGGHRGVGGLLIPKNKIKKEKIIRAIVDTLNRNRL